MRIIESAISCWFCVLYFVVAALSFGMALYFVFGVRWRRRESFFINKLLPIILLSVSIYFLYVSWKSAIINDMFTHSKEIPSSNNK